MSLGDRSGLFGCRPILRVENVARSIAYYVDILGFRLGFTWSDKEQRFLSPEECCGRLLLWLGWDWCSSTCRKQSQGSPALGSS